MADFLSIFIKMVWFRFNIYLKKVSAELKRRDFNFRDSRNIVGGTGNRGRSRCQAGNQRCRCGAAFINGRCVILVLVI